MGDVPHSPASTRLNRGERDLPASAYGASRWQAGILRPAFAGLRMTEWSRLGNSRLPAGKLFQRRELEF
ncbi:MAG: hypothetical protein A2174_01850 [Candidatus Portnoybacteria bacterium RBG_13_41_18]|uniref:Uncharacterized protein n=1 Tax=Candidatus Portnoybacteria bacterium RBG_13_41_18 TaxID=1801991 RepID=A0A1G2F590_9BACT|nr:MAG: hypothetical protein A2174_01850 [Candidatus Portnoybacteria bacterium RBG_13_41_18]